MPKFIVKVYFKTIIEAEDEDQAKEIFWDREIFKDNNLDFDFIEENMSIVNKALLEELFVEETLK